MNSVKLKRDHPLNDPQVRVMLALRFTEEDLQANREGYLSKPQRAKLNRDRMSWKIFLAMAYIGAPFGTIWAIVDGVHRNDTLTRRLGLIGMGWMVVFGAIIYLWIQKWNLDRDLHKGDVAVAQGRLQLGKRILRPRGSAPYFLNLDGLFWYVDSYIAFGLANNEPYAIYFALHSKTILSAEWLGRRESSS